MMSAGNRSPRSMDVALVIIEPEQPMFVDASSTRQDRHGMVALATKTSGRGSDRPLPDTS
jgi:hypothetical protein